MKKFTKIILILLSVCLISSGISFGIFAESPQNFATSDSEFYYKGTVYSVNSPKDGVCYDRPEFEEFKYITDYNATQVLVFNDNLYLSTGKSIRRVSISTGEDNLIYESPCYLGKFALSQKGLYVLQNGDIILVKSNETSPVVTGENIMDFWLESAVSLSYVTQRNDYIYTRNLVTGSVKSKGNYISEFEDGVPIKAPGGNQANGSITTLRSKFPDGRYWNHVGSSSNNPDGTTTKACTHHDSGCNYSGSCGCNSFSSCIQCMGYAFKCGYDVYGSNPKNWTVYTSSSYVDNVKPGDVIRYRGDTHSIFVTGVSGNTITFTDCNWGHNCIIRWGATISKSTVKSSFTKLYSAPYSAPGGSGDGGVYTVTFEPNGGTVDTSSIKIYAGNAFGELPVPQRTGYSFEGWYTSASGGTQVKSTDICRESQTLYAQWKVREYVITFDANGGKGQLPATLKLTHGNSSGVTIGAAKPTRDGYKFKEWNTKPDGTGKSYTPGTRYKEYADATLYAIWQGNTYYVYYKDVGVTPSKSVVYGEPYGELFVPTKTGYDFEGWYLDKTYTKEITAESIVEETGNISLYPLWSKKKYTVTYDANGGKGAPSSQEKIYDESLRLSNITPTKEGHTFLYWASSKGGTYYPGGTYTANEATTFTAVWDPDKYTVKFNANGGTNPPEDTLKKYGIDLILPEEIPVKIGFDFTEWNTKENGSGTSYAPGSKYTSNSPVTLYAQWDVAKYKITYDLDGGTSGPDTQIKIYGNTIVLSNVIPKKTGHIFKGWSDGEATYSPGESYSAEAHLALTAIWEREKYTITFNGNGVPGTMASQTKEYGIDLTLRPCSFEKYGYECDNWNTSPDGKGTAYKPGGVCKTNTPLSLYAIWVPRTFTITFVTGFETVNVQMQTCKFDSAYGKLPTPSKPGYTFNGWFTAKEGGTRVYGTEIHTEAKNLTFYAHWTANIYTVTFDTGVSYPATFIKNITFDTPYGDIIPDTRDGYIFAGWFTKKNGDEEIKSTTLLTTPNDHTLYAAWVKREYSDKNYTATFIADGKLVDYVGFDSPADELISPAVPEKAWYNYHWNDFTLTNSDIVIFANREYATYTATFVANGVTVGARTYNKLTSDITPPAVPEVTGHTGKWELYSLLPYGITVNALYRPNTYTVTFKTGNTDTVVSYLYGAESIEEPPVPPKTGKTGVWSSYELGDFNSVVVPIYTSTTYYATFVADGEVIDKVPFIYGDRFVNEPAVPLKYGFTARWASYDLVAEDITVNAEYYCIASVIIYGYVEAREESYRTTITFKSKTYNAPEGCEIHWYVNGKDEGTGTSFTVKEAKSSYEIKAVLYYNGERQAESPTEKVIVKDGFFQKIIAFFKAMFRRLPNIVQ